MQKRLESTYFFFYNLKQTIKHIDIYKDRIDL